MAAPGAKDTIVVVTGGDAPPADDRSRVPGGAFVIAADSGIAHAQALGLPVDLAVGDFDSVGPAALARVEAAGAAVERHPRSKDATDLELALDAAAARRPSRVVVLGGHGGRVDHHLANALLLASPAYAGFAVVAHMGGATITVVRREAAVTGRPGDLVSLLAVGGPARSVTTDGLLYPLAGEDLLPGSTRGISNELAADRGRVTLVEGTLLLVQPEEQGTHHLERNLT